MCEGCFIYFSLKLPVRIRKTRWIVQQYLKTISVATNWKTIPITAEMISILASRNNSPIWIAISIELSLMKATFSSGATCGLLGLRSKLLKVLRLLCLTHSGKQARRLREMCRFSFGSKVGRMRLIHECYFLMANGLIRLSPMIRGIIYVSTF